MSLLCAFFFFNDTATTEIYTLSLHDALPIFCAVLFLHQGGPDASRGAELGDLLEEVYVRVEEEREPWGEAVNVQARLDAGLQDRKSTRRTPVTPISRMPSSA